MAEPGIPSLRSRFVRRAAIASVAAFSAPAAAQFDASSMPPVPAPPQGAYIFVSPAELRQIQQALNRLGYDAGHVDGLWKPATAAAVRNFQQARGLEPTGTVTLETLAALRLLAPGGSGVPKP